MLGFEKKNAAAEDDYLARCSGARPRRWARTSRHARAEEGLAFARDAQGHHAEAERGYRDVLAVREKVLGPQHPEVGSILLQIARCELAQNKVTPDTVKMAQRARKIYDATLGPKSDNTRQAQQLRAEVERNLGPAFAPVPTGKPTPVRRRSSPRRPTCHHRPLHHTRREDQLQQQQALPRSWRSKVTIHPGTGNSRRRVARNT